MPRSPEMPTTQSLPPEARDAINAVFDALAAWRDEVGASTERYSETVLDNMAAAARALGWPKELVEASRQQLTQASKTQIQMIEQLLDAWQKQLASPASDQFMAQLRPLSGVGFGMPETLTAPLDFWMKTAELWQRNWQSALSTWTNQSSRHH